MVSINISPRSVRYRSLLRVSSYSPPPLDITKKEEEAEEYEQQDASCYLKTPSSFSSLVSIPQSRTVMILEKGPVEIRDEKRGVISIPKDPEFLIPILDEGLDDDDSSSNFSSDEKELCAISSGHRHAYPFLRARRTQAPNDVHADSQEEEFVSDSRIHGIRSIAPAYVGRFKSLIDA